MKCRLTFLSAAILLLYVAGAAASPNSRVKIDTVPAEYTPINSPTNREPVSLSSFHFEVNPETGRARVVADYTYPDELIYGPNDDVRGPRSTVAQIPGLAYDAAAHEVVYDSNGTRTVCATVSQKGGLFGHHLKIRNTGACTVTASVTDHSEDDGWSIHRFRAIDTYFEVH